VESLLLILRHGPHQPVIKTCWAKFSLLRVHRDLRQDFADLTSYYLTEKNEMRISSNKKADYLTSLLTQNGWQVALSTVLVFGLMAQVCLAVPQTQQRRKYSNDNEYVPEQLKDPPDLPFLPPYPGAIYSNILAFRHMPKKPGYSLTFHVKEGPDEVLAFYRNAFQKSQWIRQKANDGPKNASAMRVGAVAAVTVMKPIVKGYKTQVYLVYKIYGKVK
jgi:hypothetical protein